MVETTVAYDDARANLDPRVVIQAYVPAGKSKIHGRLCRAGHGYVILAESDAAADAALDAVADKHHHPVQICFRQRFETVVCWDAVSFAQVRIICSRANGDVFTINRGGAA